MTDVERDLGRLEGRQDATDARLSRIEDDLKTVLAKVDVLVGYMNTAKGGWRMLIAVGFIAAALGAGVARVINFFRTGAFLL